MLRYSALPIVMTIYCVLIVGVILYNDLKAVIFLLFGVTTSVPVYLLMTNTHRFSKSGAFARIRALTTIIQKLLMVVTAQQE